MAERARIEELERLLREAEIRDESADRLRVEERQRAELADRLEERQRAETAEEQPVAQHWTNILSPVIAPVL
jgi:hypothetical protein